MGNVSGRGEGEGSSGQPKDELEEGIMEFEPYETAPTGYHAQGAYSLHNPRVNQSTAMFLPQDYITEAPKHLAEFESPPSPPSSYDNEPFRDADFKKKPPELPPQLRTTLLSVTQEALPASTESLPPPHPSTVNHLYTRINHGGEPVAALGSTFRFRQKYVNVVLYKASRRSE